MLDTGSSELILCLIFFCFIFSLGLPREVTVLSVYYLEHGISLLTSSWAVLHQFLWVCVLEDALKDLPDTRLLISLTSDSLLLSEKITLGYTPTKEESKREGSQWIQCCGTGMSQDSYAAGRENNLSKLE